MALSSLLLLACSGGTYNQGRDTLVGYDDTADETDTDTDTDADTDTDTDADADTDSDTDTDVNWDGDCGNYYEPIDIDGWTRNYDLVIGENAGTETQTALGSLGGDVYGYQSDLALGWSTWSGNVEFGCNTEGDGLYLQTDPYDYFVSAFGSWGLYGLYWAEYEPTPRVLPRQNQVGQIGSWTYEHTVNLMELDQTTGAEKVTMTVDVAGTYLELGEKEIEVSGTTYTAYRLTNTYSMSSEGLGGIIGAFEATGFVDQYYVPGIGLVYESNVQDKSDGTSHTLEKTLTGYTGLTQINP